VSTQEHGGSGQSPVELARSLAGAWSNLSGEDRRACAAALKEGGVKTEAEPASMAPAPGAGDGGVEELSRRLAELSAVLSPDERATLESKLRKSGVFKMPSGSGSQSGSWTLKAAHSDFFREFFASQEGTELDGPRLSELSAALAGLAHSLDQLSWSTWKRIAPRSEMRRGEPLGRLIGEYASGQAGDLETIKNEIERLRQLVGALVSAMAQVGSFAHRKLGELSPGLIESSVGEQGDKACWKRYKEIVGTFDEDELEADILSSIVDYAEAMLRDVMSK